MRVYSCYNYVFVISFEDTFGPKRTRKRPKLSTGDVTSLLDRIESSTKAYEATATVKDTDLVAGVNWSKDQVYRNSLSYRDCQPLRLRHV